MQTNERQDFPGMIQKAFGGGWHVMRGVIGARGFWRDTLFKLDATPLNVRGPDGFHRRWCVDKFFLSEVERWHVDDPLS